MDNARATAAAVACLLGWGGPAPAGELVFAAGSDQVLGHATLAIALEGRLDAFNELSLLGYPLMISAGAALDGDSESDSWAGAGPVLTMPVGSDWRFEFSFMPGIHSHGRGDELGAGTLVYRSQIGASRACGAHWRVGLSLAHKSNGGTVGSNPGTEILLVAMHWQY